MPTIESDPADFFEDVDTEAANSLLTYYNYVRAWARFCTQEFGSDEGRAATALNNRLEASESFRRIQGGGRVSAALETAYKRGRLTLLAMEKLPVIEYPALAPFANFWLPVQAYYAVHGMGLATLIALGQDAPDDHRAFIGSFGQHLARRVGLPFSARCGGGPTSREFVFGGLNVDPVDVIALNTLKSPERVPGALFLAKSLGTTRSKLLDARFESRRKTLGRRNLRGAEKAAVATSTPDTTICDFLYRMRIRANYDNPNMYLASRGRIDDAKDHYRDLLAVTRLLAVGLTAIIRRKVGRPAMEQLNRSLGL